MATCTTHSPLASTFTTRSGRNYLVELSAAAEHIELLTALNACRAHVVLSGYDSPLYAEHLEAWDRRTEAATTNGDMSTGARADRTEVLWSNRPLPQRPAGLWDPEEGQ